MFLCFSTPQRKLTSMFNFRLTIVLLTCFVLTGCGTLSSSRPVTKALTCAENPYKCSTNRLCHFATKGSGASRTWDPVFYKHVNLAKQRGLTCGIASTPAKNCKTTPAHCSTIELCNFATKGSGSTKAWDTRYQRHVTLAKQKKYTCGVQVQEEKSCH